MGERARIVVVDDNDDIRALLVACLTPLGWDVTTAATEEEALAAVAANDPDVVMLDLGLAAGHGTTVLEVLKRNEETAWIPVVVASGSTHADDVSRLLEMGAHDFLKKPWTTSDLEARLSAAREVAARARPPTG